MRIKRSDLASFPGDLFAGVEKMHPALLSGYQEHAKAQDLRQRNSGKAQQKMPLHQSPEEQKETIVLTTKMKAGESIWLGIKALGEVTIEGIQEEPKVGGEASVCYTLTASVVTIRGKVTFLRCISGSLVQLELADCPELTELRCGSNELTNLNIDHCPKLSSLWCNNNQLTALDLSKTPLLEGLWCYTNQIEKLDLSTNTALQIVSCYRNVLVDLNLSHCDKLQRLECNNNALTSLDLTSCVALDNLLCNNNLLGSITFAPENANLRVFSCYDNQLTHMELGKVPSLQSIHCYNNLLETITFSDASNLNAVILFNNRIKGANMIALIKALPDLSQAYMGGSFVVHQTPETREKDGNKCHKSDVALAKSKNWDTYYYGEDGYEYSAYEGEDEEEIKPPCSEMITLATTKEDFSFTVGTTSERVYVNWGDGIWKEEEVTERGSVINGTPLNGMVSLSGNGITRLHCPNGEVTKIELTCAPELVVLHCYSNELTTVDFTNAPKLEELYIQDNQLASVDLAALTALKDLNISNNTLSELSLEKNVSLVSLSALGNKLTSIDISPCVLLEDISVGYNQLTSLDVSHNPALYWIIIYKNKFTESAIKTLFETLPQRMNEDGTLKVFESRDEEVEEGNELNPADLTIAKAKGWKVVDGKTVLAASIVEDYETDPISIRSTQDGIEVLCSEPCCVYSTIGQLLGCYSTHSFLLDKESCPPVVVVYTISGFAVKVSL